MHCCQTSLSNCGLGNACWESENAVAIWQPLPLGITKLLGKHTKLAAAVQLIFQTTSLIAITLFRIFILYHGLSIDQFPKRRTIWYGRQIPSTGKLEDAINWFTSTSIYAERTDKIFAIWGNIVKKPVTKWQKAIDHKAYKIPGLKKEKYKFSEGWNGYPVNCMLVQLCTLSINMENSWRARILHSVVN